MWLYMANGIFHIESTTSMSNSLARPLMWSCDGGMHPHAPHACTHPHASCIMLHARAPLLHRLKQAGRSWSLFYFTGGLAYFAEGAAQLVHGAWA